MFKAAVAWFRYQVTNPPADVRFGGKYGVDIFRGYFNRLIPLLASQGDTFKKEANYLSKLYMFAGSAYSAAWHKKTNSANSLELNHANNIFQSLLYETDDKVLWAMLVNFRDNWSTYLDISIWGRAGMIKPDYTFFHHGEMSYWDVSGYPQIGRNFSNTLLDFDPKTHKILANMIARYNFGPAYLQGIKGGQSHNWGKYMKLKNPSGNRTRRDPLGGIKNVPHAYLFDYFYNLDWAKVPAAKKFLRGVMGNAVHKSQEVKQKIITQYPKLEQISPQRDIHLTANWTGACTYKRDLVTVYALGGKGITQWRGGTPLRRYGSLMVGSTGNSRPLGVAQQGYSWTRIPGNTMPELTEQDWREMPTSTQSPAMVNFGYTTVPGNGALTFNETDHAFGTSGNFALKVKEGPNSKWKTYGVEDFQGHKSYHFFRDKVVALGSDYQANTKRSMSTVLLQDMVDDIPWSHRDINRWNTGTPQTTLNGKVYHKQFSSNLSLSNPNYIISPYGNAWIIPGGQKGRLKVEWKERVTQYRYRFHKVHGGINPGSELSKGTGVIASLEQDSRTPSLLHFCLLLNSDGKSPEEFKTQVQDTMKHPGYKVLRQDSVAHAVSFEDGDTPLHSYLVFTPKTQLKLPYVKSTNKRMNLMFQKNEQGQIIISICDPEIGFESYQGQQSATVSRTREIKVVFAKKMKLISSHSGLSEANPQLNADITELKDNEGNITGYALTYNTANAITDTFVLEEVTP